MKLTAHPSGSRFAKRIKVNIEGSNVATVTCDGTVQFSEHYEFSATQLEAILAIAKYFNLFYNNIPQAAADENQQ
jgi:hypothetical protein